MEFTKSLIKGKLIKRYKRFFVDVKLDNQIVTAHCPNTGSIFFNSVVCNTSEVIFDLFF